MSTWHTTARELESFYWRYNECCNEHRLSMLGKFVHENVEVNGEAAGLARYTAELTSVVDAFEDHRLRPSTPARRRQLAVRAHRRHGHRPFLGVAPTGGSVTAQEFAIYRVRDGRIAAVGGTVDNVPILAQLTAPEPAR